VVLCDEIDLCDTNFHKEAVEILETGEADLVIGSKLAVGAADERPLFRHAASIAYSTLLKVLLGYRGTDTHGLKAFRRLALLDVVRACLVDKDVFASEFVIRADRARIGIKEVPVQVIEKRPPSINLFKRVPNVMKSVAKLTWSIRIRGQSLSEGCGRDLPKRSRSVVAWRDAHPVRRRRRGDGARDP